MLLLQAIFAHYITFFAEQSALQAPDNNEKSHLTALLSSYFRHSLLLFNKKSVDKNYMLRYNSDIIDGGRGYDQYLTVYVGKRL